MIDISTEIEIIRSGVFGSDIREAIVDALTKLSANTISTICTRDEYTALPETMKSRNLSFYIYDEDKYIVNGQEYPGEAKAVSSVLYIAHNEFDVLEQEELIDASTVYVYKDQPGGVAYVTS